MAKIAMGKSRTVDNPYLTIEDPRHGWTWKVLKAYAADPNKPYARWFCAVSSPYTFGDYDLGDTYISDIDGYVTQRDPEVPDTALPVRLQLTAKSVASIGGIDIVEVEVRR